MITKSFIQTIDDIQKLPIVCPLGNSETMMDYDYNPICKRYTHTKKKSMKGRPILKMVVLD